MTSQHQQNFLRLQTAPSQPLYPSTTIQTLRKLVERSCTICLFIVYLFLLSPGLYAYAETYVSGTIAQDTTWTQAGSPYIVTGDVSVRHLTKDGPVTTLTIEPGVIIKFEPGTGLYIGYQYYGSYHGALVAQGTADQPIVFTSNAVSPQPEDWKGVFLYDPADDEGTILEHCVIEYGGYTHGTNLYLQHASPTINNSVIRKSSSIGIYAEGSGSDNAVINGNHLEENVQGISLHTASPSITGNTLTANSYGMYLYAASSNVTGNTVTTNDYGIYLSRGAPSINGNTITNNNQYGIYGTDHNAQAVITGNTVSDTSGTAISLSANAAQQIGSNSGSGNGGNYVGIRGGEVWSNVTWSSNAMPYVVSGDITVRYHTSNSETATLTIEPGATVKFEPATGLYIGYYYWATYYGALVAQGTSEQPIVFTSNSVTPQPGDWKGIYFSDQSNDEMTFLEHCVIEYGGHTHGTNVYLHYASPTISKSLIRKSSSKGLYASGSGTDNTVITETRFEENQSGMYVQDTSPNITGNTMTANSYGLYLYDASANISGNTITANDYGMNLTRGTPHITGNTITANSQHGIYGTDHNGSAVITGNTLSGNGGSAINIPANEATYIGYNSGSDNGGNFIEIRGGEVWTNTTWAPNALPYVISDDVTVRYYSQDSETAILIIEPGVTVKFEPATGLYIGYYYWATYYGALMAQGTQEQPIIFTSNSVAPQPGDWKGIYFRDQSNDEVTILEHCLVEYGGHTYNANVHLYYASPTIQYNTIRASSQAGIYAVGTDSNDALIRCNNLKENRYGIYTRDGAQPTIDRNNFLGNSDYGMHNSNQNARVNAINNWWGDVGGPNLDGAFPFNSDWVSINVDYEPWLLAESECISAPPTNSAPFRPNIPTPMNNAANVPLTNGAVGLSWVSGDPNPWDAVVYDVWFGTSVNTLTKVATTGENETQYVQEGLLPGTPYVWKIVARDTGGLKTEGPLWQFITQGSSPDLLVSDIVWAPHTGIEAGQEVTFTATVQNATGNGPTVDSFQVEFQIDGSIIGIQGVNQILFSDETITVSQTWTALPGIHTITVIVDSTAVIAETEEGNNSLQQTLPSIEDTTAPQLLSTVPEDGGLLQQGAQIGFTLFDPYSPVDDAAVTASIEVRDNNTQLVAGTTSENNDQFTFTPLITPLAEGTYTVLLKARDVAGNEQNYSFSFIVDTSPPLIPVLNAVLSPTENPYQLISGTKEVNVAILLNGQEIVDYTPETTWQHTVFLNDGENLLTFVAQDRAGNQSTEVTETIIFEDSRPLPVTTLTVDGEGNGTSAVLDWSDYNESLHGDIVSYRIYVEASEIFDVSGLTEHAIVNAGTFSSMVENLTRNTSYWFAVVPVDTNGQIPDTVSSVSALLIDTIPPEDISKLQVECFETGLTFIWDPSANSHGDLAGYKAYFDGDTLGELLTPGTINYEKTGLARTTAYPLMITAYDQEGNESQGVTITGITLLDNPANLVVEAQSGYVNLSWDGVEPAQHLKHYAVYVSENDFSTIEGMTPRLTTTATSTGVAGLKNNVTYYFAVTAVNNTDGENNTVTTVSATPLVDMQSPELSNPSVDEIPLTDGQTLRSPVVKITVNATDPSGMSRVEFSIDGTLLRTDYNGSPNYFCYWDIVSVEDGSHTLSIVAYDTLGNSNTVDYTLNVALDPPPAPVLTQPADDIFTNQMTLQVSGTAALYSEIILFQNDVAIGEAITVDASGNFTIPLTLTEGENRIQATAKFPRTGNSALSDPVTVTLDTSIPSAPTHLEAQSKDGGAIQLHWRETADISVKGYDLYRAMSSFTAKDEAVKVNTSLISGTTFTDLPVDEGEYYYRLVTVSHAENESELSEEVSAQSDRTPPHATAITYTPMGNSDPETGRIAPGTVNIMLTVSEPLQAVPFLSITPENGFPISVELTEMSETEYAGSVVLSESTPTGTAYAVFSARDVAGNRGTEIDTGALLELDTDGPAVSDITLEPGEPIQNDQASPVSITAIIGLTETIKPGEVPELSYLLSGEGRQPIIIPSLSETAPQADQAQAWQGSFTLPADAGDPGGTGILPAETLRFIYNGADDLGNVSTSIVCSSLFEVYQGDLPPLGPPENVRAQSLPEGEIAVSWDQVEDAVGYQLYRQAPGESELTGYQQIPNSPPFLKEDQGEFFLEFEETVSDGTYIYAVASLRQANDQEAISAMSTPVEVNADSVAPDAPLNLVLELLGTGIKAQWEVPVYAEPVTYAVYRADALDITTVEGLTPLVTGIPERMWIDPHPSPSEHCYVVTAVDGVGNESAPSNSFYLNFDLLPVSSLHVRQQDNNSPVVSWTHAGGSIAEYNIYLDSVKLNQELLTSLSYTDTGYAGDDRQYTVTAIDSNGVESLGRSITLPRMSATLGEGEGLRRGIMNRLEYLVENLSFGRIDDTRLKLQIEGQTYMSEKFGIDAGMSQVIPVIVGGEAGFPDLASVTSIINITPNEGETVEIVRSSEIEVSDGMLVLGLLNEELIRGGTGEVRFTLQNTGEEEIEIVTATGSGSSASDQISLSLLDVDGNVLSTSLYKQVLGEGVVTIANGKTVARIPAGSVFTSQPIEIPIPVMSPDDVTLRLDISQIHYHLGTPEQVTMEGLSTTHQVSLVDTSYYGEVLSITPEISNGDEDILITGHAVERTADNPMPEVPLNLVISVNGFERTYEVFTDNTGSFAYTFVPLSGESGVYTVWAVHPDRTDKTVQGQFVINRIIIGTPEINLNVPRNYTQPISITITAGEGTEIHNLHLLYNEPDQPDEIFPQGVNVTLGDPVDVLSSGQSTSLDFTVSADNTADDSGKIVLQVKSDESGAEAWGSVSINTYFSEAEPALFYTPDHLETGVALDESITEAFVLENKGLADLHDISLSLVDENGVPAPDWAQLNAPASQGTLAVGEQREISLSFSPHAPTVLEGIYSFYLQVNSANYPKTDIPLFVSVTQSGAGDVLFKVADIYTGTIDPDSNELIQGLAGARIRVQNEEVLTVEQTQTTDDLGETLFTTLPAGRYKFRITADNHQEQIGRFWIKPGVTATQEIFLRYDLVTVEWRVTEISIEDRYETVLTATYETDVPAAVVVVEPTSINFPEMKAGDVYYGEFTLTNHGLIRADDLNFKLPEDDENFKYELLTGLPQSLEPKERITVPYKIICLTPPDQDESPGPGDWSDCYLRCGVLFYIFECMYKHGGEHWFEDVWVPFCFTYGNCVSNINGEDDKKIPPPRPLIETVKERRSIKPSFDPSPERIDGVICWPVAERKEVLFDINLTKTLFVVGCEVNALLRELTDEAEDLTIKVPAGSIIVKRSFYGDEWHWEHIRNNLQFVRDSLGGNIETIVKADVRYRKSATNSQVYIHEAFKISSQETGYRWEDKWGNWKEYDTNGRMTSYGILHGVIGKLLYEPGEDGKLIGIADRNDRQVIWFEYDTENEISAARDLTNRRVEYSYTDGKLTNVVDGIGNVTSYEYDSDGRMTKKVDAGGRPTLISYDEYGSVTQAVDGNGNGHFFQYGYDEAKEEFYAQIKTSSGMLKEIWYDRDGNAKRMDVNGRTVERIQKDGRTWIITDEKGNSTQRNYDEWDNLTRILLPDGSTSSFEYDHTFNKPLRITDQRGNTTTFQYDGQGNPVQKDESGIVTSYTYNELGQILTASLGDATTTFTYETNGNLASMADPEGNVTRFLQYDVMGNLLEMLDPRGNTWNFDYDDLGRLISQTDPLGNTTTYQYDGANNRTAVINPLQSFGFEYDDHNNLIRTITPSGAAAIDYNTDHLPIRTIDQEGKESFWEYDNEGRLLKAIDGVGNAIIYHYDTSQTASQPVQIDYPTYSGGLSYDKLERIIREDDEGNSKSYAYDAAGNLISVTDEEGKTTQFEYDAFNRLIKISEGGRTTERSYDERGNLISVKDPNGGITRFEYDKNNRLSKSIRPMGEESTYEYDAGGNRTSVVDAKGQQISYEYDALNRLTRATYSGIEGSKTVEFTYNALGNVSSYDDSTTSATYSYDNMQRKIGETLNYGPFSLSYAYTYYANGLKKSFTGPDGIKYEYSYDANNRLSDISILGQGQLTYNTYQWNSPLKIVRPGGAITEYNYDPLMRLASITAKDPGQNTFMSRDYQYSPTGNITTKNTEHGNYSYQYDNLYRLTGATNPTTADETYSYDSLGNRLTAAGINGTWTYNQNNELLGYADVAYEYDENGNMTQKKMVTLSGVEGAVNYIYDAADRLIRVVDDLSGIVIAEYYYDPFGRRLWKEVGGVRTYFFYADEGLIAEYNASGQVIKTYGYAPNSLWSTDPLFQKVGSVYYWYENDHLGTPQKLVNTNGSVVWAATYDSFGNCQINVENVQNHLRFPGQYYDVETGLYYNLNRYYDPTSGRYLRTDPFGEGLNLYAYVFGNPVTLVDPEGLCVAQIIGGTGEAFAGFTFALFTATTGIGIVGGTAVGLHGIDVAVTGFISLYHHIFTGEYVNFDTYTSRFMQERGVPRTIANIADMGISIIGTWGVMHFPRGKVTVTHWGPEGMKELRSGDWVMRGRPSYFSHTLSGTSNKFQPRYYTPFEHHITRSVPASTWKFPPGLEKWKAFLGQRIYNPGVSSSLGEKILLGIIPGLRGSLFHKQDE